MGRGGGVKFDTQKINIFPCRISFETGSFKDLKTISIKLRALVFEIIKKTLLKN